MASIRQIHDCCRTIGRLGIRLPLEDQRAWQSLAVQFAELAKQQPARWQAWDAPGDYADAVGALRAGLDVTDAAAPAALVARWLDGWLRQHTDHDGRAQAQAFAQVWADPQRRRGLTAELDRARQQQAESLRRDLAGLPPRELLQRLNERVLLQRAEAAARGWAMVLIRGATLESDDDVARLDALSNAGDLSCAYREHPWRGSSDEWELRIGPPTSPSQPPADQVAAELAVLAAGLDPGWWHISTS